MKKNNPFSKSIAIVLCTLSLLLTTTTQFDVIPALVLQGEGDEVTRTECEKLAIRSQYQEALKVCQRDASQNINSRVLEAYSRYMLGEKENAYRILYEVFQENPLNLYLILSYAEIFDQQGYKIEPMQLLNFAVQVQPNNSLAVQLNREKKFDQNNKDEQILIESAQLNKDDPQYQSKICVMNFELKNHLLTMDSCMKAFEKDQNNDKVAFALAVTAFRLEDEENFQKYSLLAAQLNKQDPAALNNLGVNYHMQQKNDYAISAFKQAIQQDQFFFRTYYNLAYAFIEQENYPNAIASLKRYNSIFPYDSNGYYLLGYAYQKSGDLQNALEQYDLALKVQPANVNALYNKAHVLQLQNKPKESLQTLKLATRKQDIEDFDIYYGGDIIKISVGYIGEYKCYSPGFDFNKDLRSTYEQIAEMLFENKRYGESLECYRQLLEEFEGSNADYYKKIGDLYLKSGRIDIATQAYADGLEKYPNNIQLLLGNAAVLQAQQKDQEAEQLYNQILGQDNRNFKALNNLGYLYLTKEDYAKSKQYFEQALQVEPNDAIVLLNLGKVEFAQNNLEQAKKLFEQVIEIDPLNAQAYYMLSKYYSSLEKPDFERAMQLVNRAIYLDGAVADFYLQKGSLFDQIGLPTEALPSYENLSRLAPDNVFVLMKLGSIYDVIDAPEQSAAIYENVVALEPSNYSAFYLGGVALLRIGDYQTSAAYLQRATELEPNFAEAYIALGDLSAVNQQYEQAKQYFQQAQTLQPDNQQLAEKLQRIDVLIKSGGQNTNQ